METPTLEPLELFEGQIGEEENLFFTFKDQGGREVALRYDQTVPTCRVVGRYFQDLPTPFRRYQIQPAFRAEKPQKGRYREFLQCDADIFGIDSPLADAEVIALSLDIYRQLGFKKVQALINDRALMKDLPYEAVTAIDKIEKIGEDGVIRDMEKKGIELKLAKEYLDYVKKLKPNDVIKTIINYLEKQGFDESWYAFKPTIARSFSYSTGPIWEVVVPDLDGGSVLGGERFDKLINKVSGVSIPATGFGLGFDRTLEAAEELGLIPDLEGISQALVSVFDENSLDYALQAANKLREAGIRTELYPDTNTKLGKQLAYANKKGVPIVIVAGENEVKKNEVVIKNMSSRSEQTAKLDLMVDLVKRELSL